MNEWAILGLAFCVTVVALYFIIRTEMDPRVRELADLAYVVAAEIAELPARGCPPPVRLKAGAWETRGVNVVGNYKWTGAFRRVLWDRILVVDDPAYIWTNMVHEMTHAVRRRNGKPSSERAAERAEALAAGMAPPNLAALLEKLR